MTKNKIGSHEEHLKLLEEDLYMAEKNKKMFYRLWLKWSNEHMDIERAIDRLNTKRKSTPQ